MARDFGGDAEAIRKASSARVARLLGVNPARWLPPRRRAFESLDLVLDSVKALPRGTAAEKRAAAEILRAKSAREEGRYLALMQRHRRMRAAFRMTLKGPEGGACSRPPRSPRAGGHKGRPYGTTGETVTETASFSPI